MTSEEPERSRTAGLRSLRGWILLVVEVAYLWSLHQGIGVPEGGFPTEWWHPDRSWLDVLWISDLEENVVLGTVLAAVPAALLAGGVFWGTRSAVARWLALSGVTSALLFGFYGLGASRVWEFFHWRGSLVMLTIGGCVGGALASPWLARSWLRLRPTWQALTYMPVLLGIVVLLRHTTGTDESLSFSFSPWPAVTIFGLEVGAYSVVGVLIGVAAALAGLSLWPQRRAWAALVFALGVGWPFLWMLARFGSLPDGGAWILASATLAAAAVAGFSPGGRRIVTQRRRAGVAMLGAILAFLPLFFGRALSTGDYTVTRYVRAREVSNALAKYFSNRDGYPDELDELVELGYFERLPRPRVGFDLVYAVAGADPIEFHYQSLGSSYVLEFEFTEWVQCAYNPPWEDDFEDEEPDEDADDDRFGDPQSDDPNWDEDVGGESWSCPDSRPELW